MTREVITVSPSATLADAWGIMRARRIRHLPVVDGGRLVGLVAAGDLRAAAPLPGNGVTAAEQPGALGSRTVADIMIRDVVQTSPRAPVEEAARLLYEHRIGCLPVLADGVLVGIITETDVLRAFVDLFGAREPYSRIEVRMPNRPGELARVVRLIGIDYRINITGLVIPPVATSEAVAIIHLQTQEPGSLVEALQKLGYQVGWPSL
ncbi:MAG: CBS domain-containing protein [Gemmatimonadetes bacterium]|nr:CBS domain-containing protein [Gemmatimonadota bacterium]